MLQKPPSAKLSPSKGRGLLDQTLWVWFFSMFAIALLGYLNQIPKFKDYTQLLVAFFLIIIPFGVLWKKGETCFFFETSLKQLAKSLFWFLLLSAIIFPILEIANRFLQAWYFEREYFRGIFPWKILGKEFLEQAVLVGLPEEFFYRGYMQNQLNKVWGRPYRFLGAQFGKSLILTSILFAFSHSLTSGPQFYHLGIVFSSLVFGWLREKTGTITASALFHGLSNTYVVWISINYG